MISFGLGEEKILTFLSTTSPSGKINFLPITFRPEDNKFGLSLLAIDLSPVPIIELSPITVFLSMIVSSILQFFPMTTSLRITEFLTEEPSPTITPGDRTESSTSPSIIQPQPVKIYSS